MSGISAIMSLLNVKTEAPWVCLCTHVAFSPQTEQKHWLCFKLNVCAEYRQVGLSGLSHIHYCIETHFIFIFPSAMKSFCMCVLCLSNMQPSRNICSLFTPSPASRPQSIQFKTFRVTKTKMLSGGAFRRLASTLGQVLFYFPGGGKIALFLGNFITFLYIMQSL